MRAVDPEVLIGRDPAWKEAWEEHLTDEERREVRRAVTRGRTLDNAELAPYLMGLLAREQRNLRWKVVLWIGMFALWLFAAIAAGSSFGHWFYLGLAAVFFVSGIVSFWVQRTWLARAERLNLSGVRPTP